MLITSMKYLFSAVLLTYFIVLPVICLIRKASYDSPFTKLEVTDIKHRKNMIILTLVLGIFIFFLSLYMNGFLPSDFLAEFNNSFYGVYALIIIAAISDMIKYLKRKDKQAPYKLFVMVCTSLMVLSSLVLWIYSMMRDFNL